MQMWDHDTRADSELQLNTQPHPFQTPIYAIVPKPRTNKARGEIDKWRKHIPFKQEYHKE